MEIIINPQKEKGKYVSLVLPICTLYTKKIVCFLLDRAHKCLASLKTILQIENLIIRYWPLGIPTWLHILSYIQGL